MSLHAAKIAASPRLQNVLEFLRRNGSATTLEIVQGCGVCAVNSIIAEIRANGYEINCQAVPGKRGVYKYTLIVPVKVETQDFASLPETYVQADLFGGL